MSKHKTHKGLAKRIRITGTGKVKHKKSGTSHLNSGFTGQKTRDHRRPMLAAKSIAKRFEAVLNRRLRGRDQDKAA